MEPSIYEFPDIFRRVHMERPHEIGDEVRFMRQVWERHRERPVRRVLDIASGNSPHGQILAREGIAVVGIDRSPTMIAAGRRESRGVGAMRFYRRAIERFALPEAPFDAALFMSETFPVMTTNAALMSHLRSVGRMLRRGGLYCIDIDRHDGIDLVRRRRLWRKRVVRIDGLRVWVREFHRPIAWHQAMHSIYELECTIGFAGGAVRTRDLIPVRYHTPPTIELMARASGMFELAASYADLSMTRPIEQCGGRWFAVLKRI
ncbi:MAG TPA: class I SAM-dependent methyltransferase [Candidatus Binataceae bacterium]|nr:class I SAM-dependent methyltransferase [Candidatus Binataceae bacterium]